MVVAKARERIREVNRKVVENIKLGNRTKIALEILLTSTSMTELMNVCKNLEIPTRYSAICCKLMIEQNAIQILFTLIQSCNRSKPHIELLKKKK